jgi:uncharacterized protein (DUF1501 family)
MSNPQRRRFLRSSSALLAASSAGAWLTNLASVSNASAQSSGAEYRALVCIFMAGGNDAHNTVIATDEVPATYYGEQRGSLALPIGDLLPISIKDPSRHNDYEGFGLHPQLKNIHGLYRAGSAAILANVGPLLEATDKSTMGEATSRLPKNLASHNDQTSTWQAFGVEGSTGGWGGRMMDKLATRNGNPVFSSIGVNTNSVWLSGQHTPAYMLGTGGFYMLGGNQGSVYGSTTVYDTVRTLATNSHRVDAITQDYLKVAQRTISSEQALRQGLPVTNVAPWGTPSATIPSADPLLQYVDPSDGKLAFNPLAAQLQVVARMISSRNHSLIGAKRQVFMVSMGGFDTHSNQLPAHASLLARLDHAVAYFQNCLSGMPGGDLRNQVTTFTASEFGRALVSNGDGSDHGWGGHHFIIGGAVKGGDMYGRFPMFLSYNGNLSYASIDMLDGGGALLPAVSLDQYVYTLGKWMGVAESDLVGTTQSPGIAPNILNLVDVDNPDRYPRDLGFFKS